ncbi:S-methyl-5'-thioadenosine phosphorylase-like [Anthonomus grandis grandis]|uniref:S-methyl-5'-thioadenosine phosphorylase-like n=1 Tax=Anthonomus grandis grandis TaxID=2921223 RepID=UPI0021661E82|nr:S-methyl-5'-thioadenosine phosphorylase-like [Anthonomus grandis grandis]
MATKAKIGIIGGTGLDNPDLLKDRTEKVVSTPYGTPSDALILGSVEEVPVVILARHGRKHDILPTNVNYRANIWALKEEGCTHVIATNACGSLQEEIAPGNVVILDNFIDRTTKRETTFYDGTHLKGVCHMPMEPAFCSHTRQVILETAKKVGIEVRDGGTIVVIEGPRFSSKAESNVFRSWGAHLIGMTTSPEVALAKEAGLCYASIAMATDYDCWRDCGEKVSHKYVLETFHSNVKKVLQILLALIPRMGQENWDKTVKEAQALAKDNVM